MAALEISERTGLHEIVPCLAQWHITHKD